MPELPQPVRGFGTTFLTMFKKVNTEQYPEEKDQYPPKPRFHGRHQLNRHPDGLEKCIGCELCAWACPADAIFVEGAPNTEEERFSPGERYGRVYQINYLRCILCGLCIEACPTRALTMTNEYELADNNRATLIYEKADLLGPLMPGMVAPPHAMVEGTDDGDYYRGEVTGATDAQRAEVAAREAAAAARRGRRCRDGGEVSTLASLGALVTEGPVGVTQNTGEQVTFWVCATLAVIGAVGTVLSRKAVHSALFIALTMINLAVLYVAQDAPFLGMVQVIVYTGAVMMLFVFVLMVVGVDASDSLVETLKGQRAWAGVAFVGFLGLLLAGITDSLSGTTVVGLDRGQRRARRQRPGHRRADLHPVPAGLRGHLRAADHRGRRGDGADPPRAGRAAQDPGPAVHRAVRPRPAPGQQAEPRRLRAQQRRRHARAAARRLDRRGLRARPAAARRRHPRRRPTGHRGGRAPARPRGGHRRRLGRGPVGCLAGGPGMNPTNYLVLSAILFSIGAAGVLVRRNAIVVFMCIELMLNASNLAFVTFARTNGNLDGQVVAFFVMVVAAAEVVIGLAIIVTIFRTRSSASVDEPNLLKL